MGTTPHEHPPIVGIHSDARVVHPTAPYGPAIEDRHHRIKDLLGPSDKTGNTASPSDPWAFRRRCRSNPHVERPCDVPTSSSGSKSKDKNLADVSSTHTFLFLPSRYIQLRCPRKDNAIRRESANRYSIGRIGEFGVAHFELRLAVRPGVRPPGLLRQQPGARRVVSEGSHHHSRWLAVDFPADCPHRSDCHCARRGNPCKWV